MRRVRAMIGIFLAGLFLWGCGNNKTGESAAAEEDVSATSIKIQKDGTVIETILEDFSKAYYHAEGLKNMVLAEVAEYNHDAEEDISVEKFENKDDQVVVVIKYPSADAYTEYNDSLYDNKRLFFGTVAQAYDEGYSLDVTLKNVKNEEERIGKEEILSMGDKNILISGEPVQVQTFGKILFIGENVSAAGNHKANLQMGEDGGSKGEYYIIFN